MDLLISTGEQAPEFRLLDLQGKSHDLGAMLGWIIILNFWSPECDWCERVDRELTVYLDRWKDKAIVWWIASNAGEPVEQIERVAAERKLPTVLVDADQQVADKYGAQTTPHFFVVDGAGKLAYQGAWDDVTFRRRTASLVYVPKVVEALKNGLILEVSQTPPYGCVLLRPYTK